MKIRTDFVTNSSSSSFIICKKNLTNDQIEAIRNHSKLGQKLDLKWAEEAWSIEENDLFITGSTWMDNFDISELFKIIGIHKEGIKWSEYPFDLPDEEPPLKEEIEVDNSDWKDYLREILNGE